MKNMELNSLKIELIKIEVNCLKLLSDKLSKNSYIKEIEDIKNRSSILKKEIETMIKDQ
jgi:phosphopantetheine adenylyltransferase